MPRTRRAAAPDTTPADEAQASAPDAAPSDAAPKTGRRRARPATAPSETAPVAPTPQAEAETPTPTRGRRRRAEPSPDAEVPVTKETSADTPAPTKRPGGRRTRTVETTPVEARSESAPTAETPQATPPAPRRGRARKAAEEIIAEPVALSAENTPPPAARGSRRRRANVGQPDSVPDMEAPVVDENTGEPAATETGAVSVPPTSRRRRGRRRAEVGDIPETDAAPVDAVQGVESAEATADGEEGAKRSRRGRRSRRRRGEIESADDVVEGELLLDETIVSVETEDDFDISLPLITPPLPIYEAPPVVPPVLAPADGALLPRVSARVSHPADGRGLPQIAIDGQPHAPFFFFVNTETALDGAVVDEQIKAAASAGIHLYSGVMYLPLKNAYGDRSFGATDAFIQQVLAADPDAYLLPRLQCVPTNYWARTHPDQMSRYADGSEGDVSMASTEFWADCVDALEALIAHLSDPSTPGGDRIIGFHLDKGEWFYDREAGYDYSAPNVAAYQNWLHARYQQTFALRAAWYSGTATFEDAPIPAWTPPTGKHDMQPVYATARDARWPDYAQFASDLTAQVIAGLAAAVKTLSDGRLLAAASYGYTLEFAARHDSGHLALETLLRSPHLDILAGPNSYVSRGAGSPASFSAPIDSAALHGKLWLVEDDTKTFLADAETDDTYNPKIASGADTQAGHQRHFGAALAHGAGVTWMDLWGQGWLNSPDIWRELGILRDQANRLAQTSSAAPAAPDVAVIVDEASLAYLRSNPAGLGHSLVSKTRDLLLRTGASMGFYLQSDITLANFPDATLYLFLNALRVTTSERLAIREKLQRPGKTLAWVYASGLFDETGISEQEMGETIGMGLRLQPWNSRLGSQITEARHPLTERLRGGKKTVGQEEIINPSFAVTDPNAVVLAEYLSTGAASLAVREHASGWKSVFFGDPHLTLELLRGLIAYAGVPLYDTQDDVTYAGQNGVLTIHAPFTGQRTLSLPRPATVYDVVEDRIIATNARTFRTFLRARTTGIYLWGDAKAISEATGLPVPVEELEAAEVRQAAEEAFSPAPSVAETADAASLVAAILAPTEGDSELDAFARDGDEEFDAAGDMDAPEAEGTPQDDARPSAPRSRWQRRRAALRAKRDAERQAQTPPEGSPDTPAQPVDISTLMPGLPPRRMPPPLSSTRDTGENNPQNEED